MAHNGDTIPPPSENNPVASQAKLDAKDSKDENRSLGAESQPISPKDKLSLTISAIGLVFSAVALTVTLVNFAHSRSAETAKQKADQARSQRIAYGLGQDCFAAYMWRHIVIDQASSPTEKSAREEEERYWLLKAESEAKSLNLDISDLKTLLIARDPDGNPRRFFEDVGLKIEQVHGAQTGAAFHVGRYLLELYTLSSKIAPFSGDSPHPKILRSDVGNNPHPEALESEFVNTIYPSSAKTINEELKLMGGPERVPEGVSSMRELQGEVARIGYTLMNRWTSDKP